MENNGDRNTLASILKPARPRRPFSVVPLNITEDVEDITENARIKRVSFAGTNKVLEFNNATESQTIQHSNAYEESLLSSDSSQASSSVNFSAVQNNGSNGGVYYDESDMSFTSVVPANFELMMKNNYMHNSQENNLNKSSINLDIDISDEEISDNYMKNEPEVNRNNPNTFHNLNVTTDDMDVTMLNTSVKENSFKMDVTNCISNIMPHKLRPLNIISRMPDVMGMNFINCDTEKVDKSQPEEFLTNNRSAYILTDIQRKDFRNPLGEMIISNNINGELEKVDKPALNYLNKNSSAISFINVGNENILKDLPENNINSGFNKMEKLQSNNFILNSSDMSVTSIMDNSKMLENFVHDGAANFENYQLVNAEKMQLDGLNVNSSGMSFTNVIDENMLKYLVEINTNKGFDKIDRPQSNNLNENSSGVTFINVVNENMLKDLRENNTNKGFDEIERPQSSNLNENSSGMTFINIGNENILKDLVENNTNKGFDKIERPQSNNLNENSSNMSITSMIDNSNMLENFVDYGPANIENDQLVNAEKIQLDGLNANSSGMSFTNVINENILKNLPENNTNKGFDKIQKPQSNNLNEITSGMSFTNVVDENVLKGLQENNISYGFKKMEKSETNILNTNSSNMSITSMIDNSNILENFDDDEATNFENCQVVNAEQIQSDGLNANSSGMSFTNVINENLLKNLAEYNTNYGFNIIEKSQSNNINSNSSGMSFTNVITDNVLKDLPENNTNKGFDKIKISQSNNCNQNSSNMVISSIINKSNMVENLDNIGAASIENYQLVNAEKQQYDRFSANSSNMKITSVINKRNILENLVDNDKTSIENCKLVNAEKPQTDVNSHVQNVTSAISDINVLNDFINCEVSNNVINQSESVGKLQSDIQNVNFSSMSITNIINSKIVVCENNILNNSEKFTKSKSDFFGFPPLDDKDEECNDEAVNTTSCVVDVLKICNEIKIGSDSEIPNDAANTLASDETTNIKNYFDTCTVEQNMNAANPRDVDENNRNINTLTNYIYLKLDDVKNGENENCSSQFNRNSVNTGTKYSDEDLYKEETNSFKNVNMNMSNVSMDINKDIEYTHTNEIDHSKQVLSNISHCTSVIVNRELYLQERDNQSFEQIGKNLDKSSFYEKTLENITLPIMDVFSTTMEIDSIGNESTKMQDKQENVNNQIKHDEESILAIDTTEFFDESTIFTEEDYSLVWSNKKEPLKLSESVIELNKTIQIMTKLRLNYVSSTIWKFHFSHGEMFRVFFEVPEGPVNERTPIISISMDYDKELKDPVYIFCFQEMRKIVTDDWLRKNCKKLKDVTHIQKSIMSIATNVETVRESLHLFMLFYPSIFTDNKLKWRMVNLASMIMFDVIIDFTNWENISKDSITIKGNVCKNLFIEAFEKIKRDKWYLINYWKEIQNICEDYKLRLQLFEFLHKNLE